MSDLIRREDVLNLVSKGISTDTYEDMKYVIELIKAIPTAEPKVGKWIEVRFKTVPTDRIAKAKKCSICSKRKDKYVIWNYCPNCGAKMERSE